MRVPAWCAWHLSEMSGCWQVEMEQQKKFKSDNDNAVSLLTIHRSKGAHLHPPLQAAAALLTRSVAAAQVWSGRWCL